MPFGFILERFTIKALSSPDPFSNTDTLNSYSNIQTIELNPSYSSDNDHLGGTVQSPASHSNSNTIITNKAKILIDYVSLPNVYLKFVYPMAGQGDMGDRGDTGPNGENGEIGPIGKQGDQGRWGSLPLLTK